MGLATPAPFPAWRRFLGKCRRNPGKVICAGLGLLVLLGCWSADTLLEEPMRHRAERMMNANLKGYTVSIGRIHFHLWRLGFELDNVDLVQDAHPEPPVADAGALEFSIVWRELIRLRLAGDLAIRRPALHLDLTQIQEEGRSRMRLRDRGWQRAVESIYPIKLDRVKVQDGSLVYLSSRTAGKPLEFTRISMVATNVRNIAAVHGTFPSPVSLDGVLFGTGAVRFKGEADFLREPTFAARGEFHLDRVPLDRLTPLASEYQLKTTGGFLSVVGTLEYTPEARVAHLASVRIEDLRMDYITSKATRVLEAEHAEEAVKLAESVRNAPKLLLQVDSLSVSHSEIGFVDDAAKPPYRLFVSDTSLAMENLSNRADLGRSRFHAAGTFMGGGATLVSGGFLAAAHPMDLDAHLQLEEARLPDLNDFLLAHTGVAVAGGQFSVYAEMTVKDRKVEGYLKPILRNVKLYDQGRDRSKPLGKRVEMHLLQFLAGAFKNHSTQDVATVMTLSGSTSQPKTGEWGAIRKLIGNGLWRAIRPGFLDKAAARASVPMEREPH